MHKQGIKYTNYSSQEIDKPNKLLSQKSLNIMMKLMCLIIFLNYLKSASSLLVTFLP